MRLPLFDLSGPGGAVERKRGSKSSEKRKEGRHYGGGGGGNPEKTPISNENTSQRIIQRAVLTRLGIIHNPLIQRVGSRPKEIRIYCL